MGSQSVEIIRQGIWASLTGGWYYDPHQNVFCNTFHLYLWLYLMCVPFCVYLYASWWWIGWVSHLVVLAIVTLIVKGSNYFLHHMFDTGECLQEEVDPETPTLDAFRPSASSSQNASSIGHQKANSFEALEMQVVSNRDIENTTPPVGCSSRNSMISANNSASNATQTTAAVIDLKVDVHHKDSSGSEEGSIKPQEREGQGRSKGGHDPPEEEVPRPPAGEDPQNQNEIFQKGPHHAEKSFGGSEKSSADSRAIPDSHLSLKRHSVSKDGQPARHRKKLKNEAKVSAAMTAHRTMDLEDCVASTSHENGLPGERPPSRGGHSGLRRGGPSTSRSCRATPDSLLQSRNLSISKGERSCSAPNCSLEVTDGEVNLELLHRLSYCQEPEVQKSQGGPGAPCRERERKGKKTREERKGGGGGILHSPKRKGRDENRSRGREKDRNKASDVDSEDDPSAKDSSSPLLNRPQGGGEPSTQRKGTRPTCGRSYHPLVCRRATSMAKDALKVTTLTFENVYAEDDADGSTKRSSGSSSDEVPRDSSPASHGGCNPSSVPTKGSTETCALATECFSSSSMSRLPASEETRSDGSDTEGAEGPISLAVAVSPLEGRAPDDSMCSSSTSSSSSCPDIEWLFCHSESDSEFSNVAKSLLTQRRGAGDDSSPSSKGGGGDLGEGKEDRGDKEEDEEEEEEDSWTAIRSSPEGEEPLREESKESKPPSLRDPEGASRHGAIPKQRRQGLVVREGDLAGPSGASPHGGEAAGMTMDLVRKMLDVFSSYPESRPGDIKKLLVLVSLEQDSRRGQAGAQTPASLSREEEGVISSQPKETKEEEEDEDEDDNENEEDGEFEDPCGDALPQPKETRDGTADKASTSLHRKPAVRRRRPPFEGAGPTHLAPDKTVEQKLHKEYQTTFRGAVSYFGNNDDDTVAEVGGHETGSGNRNKSFTLSSRDLPPPESLLPLSALDGLPPPAIHLATCHDDTSSGAVHCFQDERGHWFTYTFNNTFTTASCSPTTGVIPQLKDGEGAATSSSSRGPTLAPEDASLSSSSMSLCSGLTVVLDSQAPSSPLAGPSWSEAGRAPKDLKPPPRASPSVPVTLRRTPPPPSGGLVPRPAREEERNGRGGILGEVMYRRRGSHRASAGSGPASTNNPRSTTTPRDLLSSGGQPHLHLLNLGTPGNPLQLFTSAIFDRRRLAHHRMNPPPNPNAVAAPHPETDGPYYDTSGFDVDLGGLVKQLRFASPAPQTVQYYRLRLPGGRTVKVRFDRLSLLALLDRNPTLAESLASSLLVALVGSLGCLLLLRGFYQELNAFLFCAVMASCQYSLFKSVQPDAASPTHGYNRVVIYSRPVYFCICCAFALGLDLFLEASPTGLPSFALYGVELTSPALLLCARDFFLVFLLFFPLLFSLGLLPQVNTFFMYVLEQVDMHVFGGNATTSLSSAFYCVLRSCFAVLFLSGFAYGGLREASGSQHLLYSIFCALSVAFSYHLSRCAANPSVLWQLIQKHMWPEELGESPPVPREEPPDEEAVDPLPKKLRATVTMRLTQDSLVCSALALIVFAVHSSTVFSVLLRGVNRGAFPDLLIGVWVTACLLGLLNHYLIPQLRTQQPWMCFARPTCVSREYSQFEVYEAAKVMWFERVSVWFCLLERNVLYPVLFLCALTRDAEDVIRRHPSAGPVMVVVCGLKGLRSAYSQPQFQYLILAFTVLFFKWDLKGVSESFLVDYFFMSIAFSKAHEFLLKLKFIVTYIAPWQITWGSAFHAFAQPFSVPHSAMLFVQAALSALLSTPLNPILGSAIFVTSYVRPVKFWERDYNTKRMDHSNTRLSSLLEQNPGADDNNLNSIFYEHLTRSLQHSLCGDLIMGRWGTATQGDCFVLASDNLNCLVHIIEMGNGLVTFQVRGLEFRGTYCQQREVEAISEGVEEDRGCCCCEPGHLPHMLSANAAFNQRWLAWQVTATKYVLEGYSISDNSATSMFQMFELRKILITYYVKSIIFFVVQSGKLEDWLLNEDIRRSLEPLKDKKFADLDPTFHLKIDDDFDVKESGITRSSFCRIYLDWIAFCLLKRKDKPRQQLTASRDSLLVSLCLALSLLGRRALGPSSQCDNVEVFLQFLHSLFKGDIRPTCIRDEWVFGDMELLRKVVAPALRISLKLHQDHFLLPDEYDNNEALYSAILEHQATLVICHEGDPQWRAAVLSGRPSLLSLRHVNDDGEDKFKIIMLNKRHLLFRVIKVNRECVRGLWAGQQQELVYLRNRNPERGSIQNAKQALRNIINSSCDQPIGYPIYVSPLTTSYADTHEQLSSLTGSAITPKLIKEVVISIWNRLRERCVEGCSSGSSGLNDECSRVNSIPDSFQNSVQLHQVLSSVPVAPRLSQDGSSLALGGLGLMSGGMPLGGSLSGHSLSRGSLHATRGSLMSTVSSLVGPQNKQSSTTLASLAGLMGEGGTPLRQAGGENSDGKEYSHREKSSAHNSRDSLTYTGTRDGPQWEAVGTVDYREKRSHGGSRGSSMSGITFLSREAVPVGPSGGSGAPTDPPEWEWEMSPFDVALRTAGSVHSLQSSSSIPRQGGTPPPSGYVPSGPPSHEGPSESKFPSGHHDSQPRPHSHAHTKSRHPSPSYSQDGQPTEKRRKQHHAPHRVRILDANQVYDTLNLGRRIDVIWPDEWMRSRGGRNFWGNWVPMEGMEGTVIHTWKPHHPDPKLRSHVERTIYLVQIQDKFVPVAKNAVRDVTAESES